MCLRHSEWGWNFEQGKVYCKAMHDFTYTGGAGSMPGQGAKIPHDMWPKNQIGKQKQYCREFNKDF